MPRLLHGLLRSGLSRHAIRSSLIFCRGLVCSSRLRCRSLFVGSSISARRRHRLLHLLRPAGHVRLHVLQGLACELLHLQRLNSGLEGGGILLQPEQHGFQLLDALARFLRVERRGDPLRQGRACRRTRLRHLLQKIEAGNEPGKIESGGIASHACTFPENFYSSRTIRLPHNGA